MTTCDYCGKKLRHDTPRVTFEGGATYHRRTCLNKVGGPEDLGRDTERILAEDHETYLRGVTL